MKGERKSGWKGGIDVSSCETSFQWSTKWIWTIARCVGLSTIIYESPDARVLCSLSFFIFDHLTYGFYNLSCHSLFRTPNHHREMCHDCSWKTNQFFSTKNAFSLQTINNNHTLRPKNNLNSCIFFYHSSFTFYCTLKHLKKCICTFLFH